MRPATGQWMVLAGAVGLMGMNTALAVSFYDNFDRADSTTVGNGWAQTTQDGLKLQPQISGSQAAFFGNRSATGYCLATITHTFDAASEVSVDLKWDRKSGVYNNEVMAFELTGSTTSLLISDRQYDAANDIYPISIDYLGTTYWTHVGTGDNVYRNYKVVADGGSARLYVDDTLLWTSPDAGIGLVTQSSIAAANQYWEWHSFYADNFAATIPEPASLALLALGALGLLRRRRK
ncbi:MAG: PEP-CTERM sorting domain-containing protein [Lentisphaeria bacterium]